MFGAYAWTRTSSPGRSSLAWTWAAFFFFGLGFSHKIVPVLVVPFLLLAEWKSPHRWKQLAAGLSGLALGMAGPFAIQYAISGPGVFGLFPLHAKREIQVESFYSTLMWIGSLFGKQVSISITSEGYNIYGDWSPIMKTLSTVLLGGFLAGTWFGAVALRSRFGRRQALALACYVLGASAVFSKVLSPQYFVWSLPLLLIAAVEVLPEKGKSIWTLAVWMAVVAGLTTWIFPYHFYCEISFSERNVNSLRNHSHKTGRLAGAFLFGLRGASFAKLLVFGTSGLDRVDDVSAYGEREYGCDFPMTRSLGEPSIYQTRPLQAVPPSGPIRGKLTEFR